MKVILLGVWDFIKILFHDLTEGIIDVFLDYKLFGLLVFGTSILELFTKYIFSDIAYLVSLGVAMLVSFLTKMAYLYQNEEEFSFKLLFGKLGNKIIKYGGLLFVSHSLESYQVNGEANNLFTWLPSLVSAIPMAMEAESILANIGFEIKGKWADVMKGIKDIGIFKATKKTENNGKEKEI